MCQVQVGKPKLTGFQPPNGSPSILWSYRHKNKLNNFAPIKLLSILAV